MRYSVRIKSYDEVWRFADLGEAEEGIPFSFESNDIAELEDRSANYSYSIDLPRTETNDLIFGLAGQPFQDTTAPYRNYECRVYVDGIEIVKDGVMYLDSLSENNYVVQIVSGIVDFFDKLNAIDFSTWRGISDYVRPYDNIEEIDEVAVFDFYVDEERTAKNRSFNGKYYPYAFPVVKFGRGSTDYRYGRDGILSCLFQSLGYTLQTDVAQQELEYGGFAIVSLNNQEGVKPYFRSDDDFFYNPEILPGADYYGSSFTTEKPKESNLSIRPEAIIRVKLIIDERYYKEYIKQSGAGFTGSNVRFFNEGDLDNFPSKTVQLARYKYDNHGYYVATAEYQLDTERTFKNFILTINVNQVDPYIPEGGVNTYRGVVFDKIRYEYEITQEEVPPTGKLTLANNLGFANAEELFKAFVQLFGLTIQVDGNNKIVKAYTFNHIINNKSKAKDWTEKMDMSVRPEVRFVFNEYAKKNYISFKAWNEYTDKAAFKIDNETLDKEKDLLEINVESSTYLDMVPYYNREGMDEFHELGATHFINQGSNVPAEEVVRGYYTPFANVLNKTLVVQASFLLTAIDIAEFDVFTPIYLKQYGRYFYINKIDSWQSGSTCKVELVRLPF